MNTVTISFLTNQEKIRPGETISGRVNWQLSKPIKRGSIRLVWFTSGKGTVDETVVTEQPMDTDTTQGETMFHFPIPNGPYSFSGKLITLTWAIEVNIKPGSITERTEFVVSPTGKEVNLAHAGR